MKAVFVVLLAVLATAMAQTSLVNTCAYQTNTFDCQSASNSVQCCLWCQAAQNSDVGTCVSGNVDSNSGQAINCKPNAQCAFFQGTCAQTSNCPGVTPYIAGTWYYPAQCNSIGGQLNINFVNQALGTFTFNSTGNQALRLPQYSGVVDQNGNIIMTAPPSNCVNGNCPTCTGTASARQLSFNCANQGNCVVTMFRSAANAVTLSIFALVACVAFLALF